MTNSSLMVFSVYCNCTDYFKKSKDVDLFKKNFYGKYEKYPDYFKTNCKRIYNDIENCIYTLKELAIYLLYNEMISRKMPINMIYYKDVVEAMKLFTNKRLTEDRILLAEIYKQLKFKSINDFFDIKDDGYNIAYHLIIKNKISPIFYLRNLENALLIVKENDIMSCELMKFIRIAEKIKITL